MVVKNIVKNDKIIYVHGKAKNYTCDLFNNIYKTFVENEIGVKNLVNSSDVDLDISFTIPKDKFNKLANLLETRLSCLDCSYTDISRISVIGNGIMSNNLVLKKVMHIIEKDKYDILSMEINESKIAIMFKEVVSNDLVKKLHEVLI